MKKIIAVLLAGVFSVSVAGCGNHAEPTEKSKIPEKVEQTEQANSTTSQAAEEKAEVMQNNTKENTAVKIGEFDKSATIDKTVLVDSDDIKVTATGLSFTNYSAELAISIENNSKKDLTFAAGTLGYSCNSVNGYMISGGYFNEDVGKGKKTNEKISFSFDELQAYGINTIADIEIGIYTSDADHKYKYYEPKKIQTSTAASYDYKTDTYKKSIDEGILETLANCKVDYWNKEQIYKQENVSIESVALITNKDGEQSFLIEFENSSDKIVNAKIASVAINDLILYGGSWSLNTINPGKKIISNIKINSLLDKEYQELIKLGDISSLSFSLVIQNSDYKDITSKEIVTVKLSENTSSYKLSGTPLLDSNGIKLTEIGILPDQDSASYAYHIFYAVQNSTSKPADTDVEYGSLSVNGYMIDFSDSNGEIPAGMTGLMRVDLEKEDIESAGIASADDIKEIEFLFKVTDENYNDILKEKVVSGK